MPRCGSVVAKGRLRDPVPECGARSAILEHLVESCQEPPHPFSIDSSMMAKRELPRVLEIDALAVAALVAVAMKVVGVLLVSALLVIPPASARAFARSPEQMAGGGAALGCLAVGGGIWASFRFDSPAGPSIVVSACILFVMAHSLARLR